MIPRVMPGNAVDAVLGRFQNLSPQAVKALEIEFGFHPKGSIITQYFKYWDSVLHFNLGISTSQYPTHVSTIIRETLPWTLILVKAWRRSSASCSARCWGSSPPGGGEAGSTARCRR